jgi:hypothetical protein
MNMNMEYTDLFKKPWHFDKFKEDKEGEYVKIVGRFIGDWDDELTLARSDDDDIARHRMTRTYNTQGYGHAANTPSDGHIKEDAQNPLGNPNAIIFRPLYYSYDSDVYSKFPKIKKMTDFFEFNEDEKFTKQLNDQFPNDQLMWHIDNFPGNPEKDVVLGDTFNIQQEDKIRFLIMLEDHQPGQVIQFGNIVYTQWKAGTIYTWEWSTLPHITWNGSWHSRMALQLTGSGSRRTWDIAREGDKNKEYHIK